MATTSLHRPPARQTPAGRAVRPGGPGRPPGRVASVMAGADAVLGGPLPGRLARWDTPAMTYAVIQGSTLLLLSLGLVMVLSSSSVDSLTADRSPFAVGANQAVFAGLGLVGMFVASRLPVGFLRRVAGLAVAGAFALQLLVFSPLGVNVLGNRNWISLGGFSLQPSEVGKVALALWCAAVMARRADELDVPRRWVTPLALGVVPIVGAVLLGGDLGTTLVLLMIVVAALFVAGVPLRLMLVAAAGAAVLAGTFLVTSHNRMKRIENLLFGGSTGAHDLTTNYQPVHALWGLASGGLTGVGLGSSRQKWDWLPEANSDFIFAIIGEELGLIGTLVVLALFCVLGWGCVRVVRRADDLFVQVLVASIAAWVLGQAAVNVAVVLKLLPVIGLPLPFISAGGSALVSTLLAIGLVQSCTRSLPGARAALRGRPGLVRRSLAVVPRTRSRR